jgi:hypothetical protein
LRSRQFAASTVGAGITVLLEKGWAFDALASSDVFRPSELEFIRSRVTQTSANVVAVIEPELLFRALVNGE